LKKTIEKLGDELCAYCAWTDYGMEENKQIHTPDGIVWCEGILCDAAYQTYLEELEEEE